LIHGWNVDKFLPRFFGRGYGEDVVEVEEEEEEEGGVGRVT
jgi:hypothetical protein